MDGLTARNLSKSTQKSIKNLRIRELSSEHGLLGLNGSSLKRLKLLNPNNNVMYQIKYILVNDSAAKGSGCESRHRFIPHIGHCTECFAVPGFKVQGSRERAKLLDELCRLRKQWPDAKILGLSELDTSASHAPVHVSDAMNAIRREMSDLP